jgi:two-component system CheB/CheR fusion protein
MFQANRPQADGLRVLVVEHDTVTAAVEAQVLATEDHTVTIAADGVAALREVRNLQPDVVLLDLVLPDLDGVEVARRIRTMNLPKRPLLVAVTDRDDGENRRRCTAVGIEVHLVKPVAHETLCVLMRQFHRILY